MLDTMEELEELPNQKNGIHQLQDGHKNQSKLS